MIELMSGVTKGIINPYMHAWHHLKLPGHLPLSGIAHYHVRWPVILPCSKIPPHRYISSFGFLPVTVKYCLPTISLYSIIILCGLWSFRLCPVADIMNEAGHLASSLLRIVGREMMLLADGFGPLRDFLVAAVGTLGGNGKSNKDPWLHRHQN